MPALRLPGPICMFLRALDIDSGTLCRALSPIPGTVGTAQAVSEAQATAATSSGTNNPLSSTTTVSTAVAAPQDLRVAAGQVTFDAEGNDSPISRYFSRVVHWPGNSLSGVTIGRGYDLGDRSEYVVYLDLIEAGVPKEQAQSIAKGAKKKGSQAFEFVRINKAKIGEISIQNQIRLFNIIYPSYVKRARKNYDTWTSTETSMVPWDNLLPKIRDILVDFVYHGFTKGPNPMKAGMTNDVNILIGYIENSSAIRQYEAGRHRAAYLRV